jgi:hypothetical protein
MKKLITISVALLVSAPVFSQQAEYDKFFLSVRAGIDYPNNNNSKYEYCPHTQGFQLNFDGAYFFSLNCGAGLFYHFKHGGEGPNQIFIYSYDETVHYVGPSLFARWYLKESSYKNSYNRRLNSETVPKWMIQASVSIGYLYDKLYHIKKPGESQNGIMPNLSGQNVGYMASIGIYYRITSFIGAGITANGLFAPELSVSNVQRNINTLGWSAGLTFYL